MKVIRFPGAQPSPSEGRVLGTEIDAMLDGELGGGEGIALRALREDVRALAGAPSTDFERELQARVAQWSSEARSPRRSAAQRLRARARETLSGVGPLGRRWLALGGAGAAVAAIVLALVLSGGSSRYTKDAFLPKGRGPVSIESSGSAASSAPRIHHAAKAPAGSNGAAEAAPAQSRSAEESASSQRGAATPVPSGALVPFGNRLQQQGASVTLATSRSGVQSAAEAVMRLAVGDGGYVESSQVQQRSEGSSEATLTLSLPSAKLAVAIASLGRIASVREVSQESQDVTSAYDSAKRRLGDAEAVRAALLRALAAVSAESRIESLREQLASNRETIAHERAAVKAISNRASNSQLAVAITGRAATSSAPYHEGLTLRHGLRDAAHVLAGVGAVLLIALAVLVPLGLLALALDWLRRGWRRRRREAALDS